MILKYGTRVAVIRPFTTAGGTKFRADDKATVVRKTNFTTQFRTEDGRDFCLLLGAEDQYVKKTS